MRMNWKAQCKQLLMESKFLIVAYEGSSELGYKRLYVKGFTSSTSGCDYAISGRNYKDIYFKMCDNLRKFGKPCI